MSNHSSPIVLKTHFYDPEVFETMKNGFLLPGLVLGLVVVQSSSRNGYARKTDSRGDARTFSGGILNQKAVEKPNPTYPQAALDARVSGVVVVEILVDEKGIVQAAKAVSGHPLLRQAAVDAAYQARFVPTRVSGNPVKVSGKLVYRFVRTRSRAV